MASEPTFQGRGYCIVDHESEVSELESIRAEGATLIRWMVFHSWPWQDAADFDEYELWLESRLQVADRMLDECERLGLKVALDLHDVPGGRYSGSMSQRLFYEPKFNDQYVEVWRRIAKRYRGHPALYGYGLMNEPVEAETDRTVAYDPIATQLRAARAIRRIDSETAVIFASAAWNGPDPFFSEPVSLTNVIYEFHMYHPMQYTHQGIEGFSFETAYSYPGEMVVDGWYVDQAALRASLKKVRKFQKANPDARIFVGEFSAVRWAVGASAYLIDCIDLFEEFGYDWVYLAWGDNHYWSLNFENGGWQEPDVPAVNMTDRKRTILNAFKTD